MLFLKRVRLLTSSAVWSTRSAEKIHRVEKLSTNYDMDYLMLTNLLFKSDQVYMHSNSYVVT